MQIHENLKPMLKKHSLSEADRIRLEIAKAKDKEKMLLYLKNNIQRIRKYLPFDETEKLLAKIKEDTGNDGGLLFQFEEILGKIEGYEEIKREVEGKIILCLVKNTEEIISTLSERSIHNEEDFRTLGRVTEFTRCLESLPLPSKITQFLLSERADKEDNIINFIKKGEFDGK